jgi:hypothetical protein
MNMSKVSLMLAGTLAAATAAPLAAMADEFSGLLDGSFAYSNDRIGPAIDTDQYVVRGSLLYTADNPGFGFQVDGQDSFYFGIKYNDAHLWSAGGSLFWRDNKGTIGVSGSYFAVDAPAAPFFTGKKSLESFGAFGEYYPFQSLTLQVKGGGTSGPVGLASAFVGGGIIFYDFPDLAMHANINFTSFTSGYDWTDYDVGVEYLPFNSVPISVSVGYDHALVAGVGYTSAVYAGLKYHFGSGRTLREYQRTGPVEYTGNATPGSNLKF